MQLLSKKEILIEDALTDEDETYLQLRDTYFKNYINTESKKHLLDAFETAKILWFVYGALASDRLMIACDKSRFTSTFKR